MKTDLKNLSIGVFDSGVGGLTVLKQLHTHLPNESYIYLGDLARVPYGTKSDAAILNYTKQACDYFIDQGVKCIVIACNTASSISLHLLEELNLGIPIIGVVKPGAKTASDKTKTKKIAVIATEATIHSNSYVQQIHSYDPNITVLSKSCPLLVPIAEEGWIDNHITQEIIKKYLASIFSMDDPDSNQTDCLLLGCTHFPILLDDFNSVLPKHVKIIDSAEATAKHTKTILTNNQLTADATNQTNKTKFVVTDNPERFVNIAKIFIHSDISPDDIVVTDIPTC